MQSILLLSAEWMQWYVGGEARASAADRLADAFHLAERRLKIGLMNVRELVESTKQLAVLLFKRLRE
jgi:hypothetical protein